VALASRDLTWPAGKLAQARVVLEQCGDTLNAAQARYVEVRWLVLAGRLAEAQRQLAALPAAASPALAVMHELLLAHIAMRQQRAREARSALQRAMRNAVRAGGRARRWILGPEPGITTVLLLPAPLAEH
jgi:hypothetical protein